MMGIGYGVRDLVRKAMAGRHDSEQWEGLARIGRALAAAGENQRANDGMRERTRDAERRHLAAAWITAGKVTGSLSFADMQASAASALSTANTCPVCTLIDSYPLSSMEGKF